MPYTRRIFKQKDNAIGRLASGISAASLTIPLQAGQGALFPAALSASATSGGSSTLLNSTGIQAAGVVAGQIIHNVTDGSWAVVLSVSTNSVTTTVLKGGSANTWANTNIWSVNSFVITLINYDTDGVTVLKREKVLIDRRSTDNLFVNNSGRGFDGSSAQTFATSDYVYLFWVSASMDGLSEGIAQIVQDIETLPTVNQKAALGGSPVLATAGNYYMTQDEATAYGTGLTQTTQNLDYAVGEADATTKNNRLCQTFVAVNSSINAVYLYKSANTGTNAGNVIVEVYAVDGSNNPTGAALISVTVLAATWNGYSTGINYISLGGSVNTTPGTTYALVVRQSTADNANHINIRVSSTDVYSGGQLKRFATADGWVGTTGDMTFQLLFGVANKIVRRDGNNQVPVALTPSIASDAGSKQYIDNSIAAAIVSFPIPQQIIGAENAAGTQTNCKMASDSAGTIMVVMQRIAGVNYVSRYTVDNKIWYRTHLVTLSWNGSANNSIIILGSFVYVYGVDTSGPTVKVARLNLADLTSETNITISGGTPSSTDSARAIFSDGTLVYLSDPGVAGQAKRYSLSGTTLTFQANVNYTGNGFDEGTYSDGTSLYQIKYSSSALNILKWNLAAGGAISSTTIRNLAGHLTGEAGAGVIPWNASSFWVVISGTVDALRVLETNLLTKP